MAQQPSSDTKLSLSTAVLININVMMGSGIFINTTKLPFFAGSVSFLGYLIIGLLMLPLIIATMQLLNYYPSGGFYTFAAQEINPLTGFASAWSYFVAKLASATLMITVAVALIQSVIPALQSIPMYVAVMFLITLFVFLNTMNVRIGSIIQVLFVAFKLLPIVTAISLGIYLFCARNFIALPAKWNGLIQEIPLVLYAALGFEAACSLSSRIQNAQKNASRVVLISFSIVIAIACLYQFFFYAALGDILARLPDYRFAFPSLFSCINFSDALKAYCIIVLHLAIACSALGGAYGIIFSNAWNLYTLGHNNHLFFSSLVTRMNCHDVPWVCMIVQGVICVGYLIFTAGAQLPLQQISALGCVLAYAISVMSLKKLHARIGVSMLSYCVVWLALASCLLLISSCIKSLYFQSAYALYLFGTLLFIGAVMFYYTLQKNSESF